MKKRPIAVTVFGWYWTVGGILGVAYTLYRVLGGQGFPAEYSVESYWQLPPYLLFSYMLFASVLGLLCGIGLLRGRNWARILALGLCFFAILFPVLVYREHPLFWINLIGDAVFTVMMWFFLWRPHATAFFKGHDLQAG